MMVRLGTLSLALGCFMLGAPAHAADKVSVKTSHYSISGTNGAQLYMSMVKRGPRHGLLSRAIAQTSYKVTWDAEVVPFNGGCRVAAARPKLSIKYTYPQPSQRVSPAVKRSWDRFMGGVRRHEEMHGKIARQMVDVAAKSVRGLKVANDRSCFKTRLAMKRLADTAYAEYEARQIKFDAAEHRDGGNIDRLILALIKAK